MCCENLIFLFVLWFDVRGFIRRKRLDERGQGDEEIGKIVTQNLEVIRIYWLDVLFKKVPLIIMFEIINRFT